MSNDFTSDEEALLRRVLSHIVVKKRTGEVGIMHGMDRFVSTQICLRKKDKQILNSAFEKMGLPKSPKEVDQ